MLRCPQDSYSRCKWILLAASSSWPEPKQSLLRRAPKQKNPAVIAGAVTSISSVVPVKAPDSAAYRYYAVSSAPKYSATGIVLGKS